MFIVADKSADTELSEILKNRLSSEIYPCVPQERKGELYLFLDDEGLSLNRDGLSFKSGFSGMKMRLKQANLEHEPLLKAVKIKNKKDLYILDATAGTGEDSLILSAGGYQVDLFERDPVIGSVLEDGIRKGKEDADLKIFVSRMQLFLQDSTVRMKEAEGQYDVIYLDPMFPKRTKSADVKKKFQLIHDLEDPCEDEQELLRAAFRAKPLKVVIKRPSKGEYLAGIKPDYSLQGKAVRYDIFNNLSRYNF